PPYWYFISDPFHTLFYDVTVITSILSNSLLILIIRTTKTPKTDNYRYLLLCFAIGDMISSISHSLTSPIVHLTSHGFFFFPKSANSLKSEGALLGKTVCLAYIFMYYQTFNILTFHFIYRYRIIAQGKLKEWTERWKMVHWVSIGVLYSLIYAVIFLWACSYSFLTNE
ncbi:hypothetical protein PFISCL1PPCAC_14256, partial [Pristionchus fissidentatus]